VSLGLIGLDLDAIQPGAIASSAGTPAPAALRVPKIPSTACDLQVLETS
jgi:hypothetical protein